MSRLPPGPRSRILANLQSARDPIGTTERWRREYGDPMSAIGLDGNPALITGSPEGVRAVFTAPPETFEPFGSEPIGATLGEGSLLVLSGAKHSAMRKLLMPPFHGQRMRVYGKQIRDITLRLTQHLASGSRFVAQDLMHAISLQTIIQLVYGVTAGERAQQAEALIGDFRQAFNPARLILPLLIPSLRREFCGLGPWARLQRATRALRSFLDEDIAARRSQGGERTDILSLLVDARYEDGTALSAQEIFEQLQTLLHAGHSTTATALVWALHTLAQEPQVATRLRAELASLGPEPTPEALARAPFLEAVCHETLRFRAILPATARRLVQPLRVAGYELSPGMSVITSMLWAHSNPALFAQPERFLPERFLERTYTPFEFFPFGGGHRRCIGAAFALYEMKIVLGTLLQRFNFELISKQPVRMVQRDTLIPGSPIELRASLA